MRHRGGTAAKRPSRERERPKARCPHVRTAAAMRPVRSAASERTDRRRSGKDTDGMKHAPAQRLRRRRKTQGATEEWSPRRRKGRSTGGTERADRSAACKKRGTRSAALPVASSGRCCAPDGQMLMSRISKWSVPAGTATSTWSPFFLPSSALAMGVPIASLPSRRLASCSATMV